MPSSRMAPFNGRTCGWSAAERRSLGVRLGPRTGRLLRRLAARGRLALARRGGLLRGRLALGRTALRAVVEIGDEPLQVGDVLRRRAPGARALRAAQRLRELLGDALAQAVRTQSVE